MNGKALQYLKDSEWSMGNGQCPECHGVHEGWLGHPHHLTSEGIGHRVGCKLAASIKDVGGEPLMVGESKEDAEYEQGINKDGIFTTYIKGTNPDATQKMYEFDKPWRECISKIREDLCASLTDAYSKVKAMEGNQ